VTFHLCHSNIIKFDGRPDKTIEEMNARIIGTTNEYVTEKDWLVYHGDFLMDNSIDRDDNETYIARFKHFLDQLRCKNFVFCVGNHDKAFLKRHGDYRPNWPLWNLFRVWECGVCNTVFDPLQRFGLPVQCKEHCLGRIAPVNHMPIYNLHPMGYELRLTAKICAEHQIPRGFESMIIVCTHYAHRVWNGSHKKKESCPLGKSISLFGHSHGSLPGIKNSFDVGFNIWNRPLSLVEILTDLMPKHNQTEAGQVYFGHHGGERE
jgi:calcineurin-like phosphoesterase family protein